MPEAMREYGTAGGSALVVTLVAGAAVASGDLVATALALAATLSVLAWLTAQLSVGTEAGITATNLAWGLALAARGRTAPGRLLPIAAAQVVGALVGAGVLALLGDRYTEPFDADPPGLLPLGVIGLVVGVLSGLAAVLADLHASDVGAGLGALLSPVLLPGALGVAVHPAALLGLAAAGVAGWASVVVVVVTGMVGHVVAGLWGRALAPS